MAASDIVVKVEEGIKEPERLGAQAAADRGEYKSELAHLKTLQAELDRKAPEAAASSASSGSPSARHGSHDYEKERRELERDVTEGSDSGKSARHGGGGGGGHRGGERKGGGSDGQTAAEADYSRMEAEALKREQRKTLEERQRRREQEGSDASLDSSDNSGDGSRDSESAARRRAHIVSDKQSTFLMGLFSNKAPWDTDKDRAR